MAFRDDSERLDLDAARRAKIATWLLAQAKIAGVAVSRTCEPGACGSRGAELMGVVIADGERCRLGLLWHRGPKLQRVRSAALSCDWPTLQVVASGLFRRLLGRPPASAPGSQAAAVLRAGDRPAPAASVLRAGASPRRLEAATTSWRRLRRPRLRLAAHYMYEERSLGLEGVAFDGISGYDSGQALAIGVDAIYYPLSWIRGDALAGFGVAFRAAHTIGLTSTASTDGFNYHSYGTTMWRLELEARYRWRISRHRYTPDLIFSVGWGTMRLQFDWPAYTTSKTFPDVGHDFIRFGLLTVEQPLYEGRRFTLSLEAGVSLLLGLSAGDLEASDTDGYGEASTTGVDIGLTLRARIWYFFVEAGWSYRRLALEFSGECARSGQCRPAEGAVDRATQFAVRHGVQF